MADTWTLISGQVASDYTDTMVFEVDSGTKKLAKLTGQTLIAGEKNSQYIRFEMDRYWDGIDIADKTYSIKYALAGDYYGESDAVSAEITDDRLRFGWVVPEEACCVAGTLMFVLVAQDSDYILKTQVAEVQVLKTIDEESVVPEPTREAWYTAFQAQVEADLEDAQEALEAAQSANTSAQTALTEAQSATLAAQLATADAQEALTAARINYGSPLKAQTTSEMTETNRVYVYTGSESGYTAGNWYYYNGSAWTSGGVYNGSGINTDTTLTQSGMAADGKATGDAISQLNADITAKQDMLTFDSAPTESSTNPVTSGGIYSAIQNVTVTTDTTLTVSGVAADAKTVGDALDNKASIEDVEATVTGNVTIDEDKFDVGNINITVNGWTYGSNEKRVRTKQGTTLSLKAGYVIGLSDYTDARFFLGWLNSNNVYKVKGWNTSDVTLTEDGDYVILMTNLTEVSQEGDKTLLLDLLSITNPDAVASLIPTLQASVGQLSDDVTDMTSDVSNNKKALQSLNLYDSSTRSQGEVQSDGTLWVTLYNKVGASDFIEVEAGETYTMQVWANPLGETDAYKLKFATLCYDSSKNIISNSYSTTTASSISDTYLTTTRTIPTGAKYIRISARYLDSDDTRMMVNKGSLAMAYIKSANDADYDKQALVANVSNVAYGLTSPLLRPAYPRVIMHRGFSSQAPENTIPAFTLAGQGGAWAIETDVYETTDGYFVLSHDDSVERMTDGTGNITEMTYAETQSCTIDAGSNVDQYTGLKMPVLSDFLKICRKYGCVAIVEIKTITNYDNLVDIIKNYGMEGSVVILTYYTSEVLTTLRSLIQCPLAFNCQGQSAINTLLTVAQNNVDIWASVYTPYITQANLDACHAVGMPMMGWTYTVQSGCESALEMGLDVIIAENFAKYE